MNQSRQEIISDITSKIYSDNSHVITVPILQNVLKNMAQNFAVLQETYTKEEVIDLIKKITAFRFQVVASLPKNPETNVLYLVGKISPDNEDSSFEEWVYDATKQKPWVKIGSTTDELPICKGSNAVSAQLKGFAGPHANKAKKEGSIAFGKGCVAGGDMAAAVGDHTTASGVGSLAEGCSTVANGESSHAEGYNTKTSNQAEHAQGRWNKSNSNPEDDSKSTLYSIGVGESSAKRCNAVEVMQNGDVYIKGLGNYNGSNATNDKSKTLIDVIADKYEKPVNGIPLSDLSESVKETIEKMSSTDDGDLYRKPLKGIPSSDLTIGLRKILERAEKSLQPEDIPLKRGLATDNPELINIVLKGLGSVATGIGAVALGSGCESKNDNTFTCGNKTTATNPSETAVGQYNKSHQSSNPEKATSFSIGIGTVDNRKNSMESTKNGEIYILGVGGYDGTNAGADGVMSLQEILKKIAPEVVDSSKYFK